MQDRLEIKAIVFDIGGVILPPDNVNYVYEEFSKYYDVPKSKVMKAINENLKRTDCFGFDEEKYWQWLIKYLKIKSDKPIKKLWTLKYAKLEKPIPEMIKLVKKLNKNYKTYVLSNAIPEHQKINEERKLYDIFDDYFISCDAKVKAQKPDKKIFKVMLKNIKLKPEECVFIDDNKNNIVTAKELGFRTILHKNVETTKNKLEKMKIKF